MLARVIRSACRPEPPVGSERPKVRTIGGVSLGMKIDRKELNLGAESAQSTQLCGLNRREGVFSHPAMHCIKAAARHARHGASSVDSIVGSCVASVDTRRIARGRARS